MEDVLAELYACEKNHWVMFDKKEIAVEKEKMGINIERMNLKT